MFPFSSFGGALATLAGVAVRPAATAADAVRAQETRPRRLIIHCANLRCQVYPPEGGLGEDGAREAARRHGFRSVPGQPEELLFCNKCARKRGYRPGKSAQ